MWDQNFDAFNPENDDIQIEKISNRDIAIIGMAANMPKSADIDKFWENIRHGEDCITEFPETRRKDTDQYLNFIDYNEHEIKYYQGGFLEEIDKFDYKFFKLSPKEASLIDPCQRLFLQIVWHALEDSGYGGRSSIGSNTGVYLGYANSLKDAYVKLVYDIDRAAVQIALTGNITAIIPSRIAYALDLKGPTMVIDTACSSSLVAVHLACQALRNGDCDMAVAGGVKVSLMPLDIEEERIGIESTDNRTKTFDDSSDGTGNGEGTAAVVLKPLNKALKDGDRIYAVVKGSAVNQDGNSAGITAPNALAQAAVIEKAWKEAGVHPETISYIEAHGTGTILGDPIEMEGIQKAFKKYTDKKQFCAVGAVKSNIGHLYEGAGIISLIKAALALKNKEIPPVVHFKRPNRKINFEESPVFVNDRLIKWETGKEKRRCGINAFGFSGTNCHIILEEMQETSAAAVNKIYENNVVTLSAKSSEALKNLVSRYAEFLNKGIKAEEFRNVCYTTNTGRGHYAYRLAMITGSPDDMKAKIERALDRGLESSDDLSVFYGEIKPNTLKKGMGEEQNNTETSLEELKNQAEEKMQKFLDSDKLDGEILKDICSLYAKGVDIEWERLYKGEKIQKAKIPLYPFEKHRCWVEVPEVEIPCKDSLFFHTEWIEEDLEARIKNTDGCVMLFKDRSAKSSEVSDELAKYMRNTGNRVIEVELGGINGRIDHDRFEITGVEEDYTALFEGLKDTKIDTLVHLNSLSEHISIDNLEMLNESQNKGVLSLFFISKALGNAYFGEETKLVSLAQYVNDISGTEKCIRPENASLFGLAKIIEREMPNLRCKCIDIDDSVSISTLAAEIQFGENGGQIAFRDGKRYVERFTEVDISLCKDNEIEIKEGGVYLITGGTGGIGLEVAKYMAGKNKVNLALVNRSKIPPKDTWDNVLVCAEDRKLCEKIQALKEIEALGSNVICYSADSSSYDEIKAVTDDLRERYGRIHGIIHSAGIPTEGFLVHKTQKHFEKVMAPKVQGTWILEHVTQTDKPDFIILFSSVATVMGAPGQGDYSAANSYLDSFASYLRKKGTYALTINWVQWKETGMAFDTGANINTIFKAIPSETAIKAFGQALNKDVTRVLIGELNYEHEMVLMLEKLPFKLSANIEKMLERLKNRHGMKRSSQGGKQVGEVVLKGRDNSVYTETEKKLGQVWGEVLGYKEIDIHDNFYELGGDSILAMKIGNKINSMIKKNISMADTLNYLTIADFSAFLDEKYLNGEKQEAVYDIRFTIKPAGEKDYYPMSSAQERLYVLHQLEPESTSYNLTEVRRVEGEVENVRLADAIGKLIKRHEILRTSFEMMDGKPVQRIHEDVNFDIEYLSDESSESVEDAVKKFVKPYDLTKVPLMRMALIRIKDESYMVFDRHHIISDAVSRSIFIEELAKVYEGKELTPLNIQYKDYSVWQEELMRMGMLKVQEEYWLKKFDGGVEQLPILNIPIDFPRPSVQSFEGDIIGFLAQRELTDQLEKLAVESDTTMFMILLTSYYTLLWKYTGQEDIIVGSPIAGRVNESLENVMGMFVNSLAIRNFPCGDKTFKDFLHEVKENTIKDFGNQEYQFDDLVGKLYKNRDLVRMPVFNTMFVLQNVEVRETEVSGLRLIPYPYVNKTSKVDLLLEAVEIREGIWLNFEYCVKLFKRETVEKIGENFLKILEAVVKDRDVKLKDISIGNAVIKEERFIREEIEFSF